MSLPFVMLVEEEEAMRRLIVHALTGFAFVVCYQDADLASEPSPYNFRAAIVSSQVQPQQFKDGVDLAQYIQEHAQGVRVMLLIPSDAPAPEGMLYVRKGSAAIGLTQRLRNLVQGN